MTTFSRRLVVVVALGLLVGIGLSQVAPAIPFSPLGPTAQATAQPIASPKSIKAGSLVIEAPWTRATPSGAKIAGGYLKITNSGAEVDRLIGGTLPVAGMVEVHEMSMDGGIMKMRKLERGLEIPPGKTVELKPGGYHIMFMDLKQPLKQGETIKGTLRFEKAGSVDVAFDVQAIGATQPGHGH